MTNENAEKILLKHANMLSGGESHAEKPEEVAIAIAQILTYLHDTTHSVKPRLESIHKSMRDLGAIFRTKENRIELKKIIDQLS